LERVYYFQEDGKTYYGCGYYLEGEPINLLFTSFTFNQNANKIHLTGYVYYAIIENDHDTIGLNTEIFLAKPEKSRLLYKTVIRDLPSNWNSNTGYFDIEFVYKMGTNLYFNLPAPFCMREVRLSELFNKKE
jgi:hypothetical protein